MYQCRRCGYRSSERPKKLEKCEECGAWVAVTVMVPISQDFWSTHSKRICMACTDPTGEMRAQWRKYDARKRI